MDSHDHSCACVVFWRCGQLAHQKQTVEGIMLLGYPAYFVTLLGFWKVLGAIALSAPRFPRLKEWAYAGVFFEMTGAAVSHAACHDAAWHIVVTSMFAALTVASWALRPQSRTLGILFGPKKDAPRST